MGMVKEVFIDITESAQTTARIVFLNDRTINFSGRIEWFNDIEIFVPLGPLTKTEQIQGKLPVKIYYKFIKTPNLVELKKIGEIFVNGWLVDLESIQSVQNKGILIDGSQGELRIKIEFQPRQELFVGGSFGNIEILEAKNVPGLKDVNKK